MYGTVRTRVPYYLGQSALLDQHALPNSTKPFYKYSLIVSPLDQNAPIKFLNAFEQVKIISQFYSYFKSRFPCSKMPRIPRNFEKQVKKRTGEYYALLCCTNPKKIINSMVRMRTNRGSMVYNMYLSCPYTGSHSFFAVSRVNKESKMLQIQIYSKFLNISKAFG